MLKEPPDNYSICAGHSSTKIQSYPSLDGYTVNRHAVEYPGDGALASLGHKMGVEYRTVFDFGVAAIGWRGAYLNDGALPS